MLGQVGSRKHTCTVPTPIFICTSLRYFMYLYNNHDNSEKNTLPVIVMMSTLFTLNTLIRHCKHGKEMETKNKKEIKSK